MDDHRKTRAQLIEELDRLRRQLAERDQQPVPPLHRTDPALHPPPQQERASVDIEELPTIVYVADAGLSARTCYVSQQLASVLGFSPAEWVADPQLWATQLHPDDCERVLTALDVHAKTGVALCVEYRLRARDGSVVWVKDEAVPTQRRPGTSVPHTIVGMLFDITAWKHTEEALRQSETRWQLAVQGTNEGLWDWHVQTDEVYLSPRWKEMLGYAESELGNTFSECVHLVHPDDRPQVMHAVEEHFAGTTDFYKAEFRVRCKDGSYKWILDRGKALRDGNGAVVRMVGSHTDITARRHAEIALREQQGLFRAFMDHSPAAAYIKDEAGRFTYVNKLLVDSLHAASGDGRWEGKTDFDVWPEQAAAIRTHDQVVLAQDATIVAEETTSLQRSLKKLAMGLEVR